MTTPPKVEGNADEEEGDFSPGVTSASSVVLLVFGTGALVSTIYVAWSIYCFGRKSASSKLVFMSNRAQGMLIIAKLPFFFNSLPYGCFISQTLLNYAVVQLWLVSYMMMLCTNHLKLDMVQSSVYSSSDLSLNRRYEIFATVFPVSFTILPIATHAFKEKYNWCITDPVVNGHSWILLQVVVFMSIILCLMGRQAWIIYKSAQKYAHIFPPKKIISRILKGPIIYAVSAVLFSFVGVVLIRGSSSIDENNTEGSYYIQYATLYIFFIPGYIHLFIFIVEKRHLQTFEHMMAETEEFESAFDLEDVSEDGDNDFIAETRDDVVSSPGEDVSNGNNSFDDCVEFVPESYDTNFRSTYSSTSDRKQTCSDLHTHLLIAEDTEYKTVY